VTDIRFTNDAIDDLRRLGPDIVPNILKKVLLLETNPHAGQPLGGELTGFRKLVVGNNIHKSYIIDHTTKYIFVSLNF